jgi:hypothetical protein
MNKESCEKLIQQEIAATVEQITLYEAGGGATRFLLHDMLDTLTQSIASHTREYELSNLATTKDLALRWNVTEHRAARFVANLHKRYGVGRKIGTVWCLSAAEALNHRPADKAGRPKKLAKIAT